MAGKSKKKAFQKKGFAKLVKSMLNKEAIKLGNF